MRTAAVIPAKAFAEAKSRLAPTLRPEERARLAEAMLDHVLGAIRESGVVEVIAVVSPSKNLPLPEDVVRIYQPSPGLNPGLQLGKEWAASLGADALLIVFGDLPLITPDDVAGIVRLGQPEGTVVLAPDRHGQGTNAMLAHPPALARFAFGVGSYNKHRAIATNAGTAVQEYVSLGTTIDIDTPEDLAFIQEERLAASGC